MISLTPFSHAIRSWGAAKLVAQTAKSERASKKKKGKKGKKGKRVRVAKKSKLLFKIDPKPSGKSPNGGWSRVGREGRADVEERAMPGLPLLRLWIFFFV